jgi:hypothetical protein
MATSVLQTIGETARQVRRCLLAGDDHEALRWVAQFVAEFERSSSRDRPGRVAVPPSAQYLLYEPFPGEEGQG